IRRRFGGARIGLRLWRWRIVFGRDAARREQRDPGGGDQWPVGPGERVCKRLNGALVDLGAVLETREVVDEGGVNDAIRHGGAFAEAIEVLEIAALRLCARRGQRFRAVIRAGEAENLVARVDE